MRGLIYGDVRGSVYEWKPVEEHESIKDPPHFTDDTVLGAAVADALITCWEKKITDDEGIVKLVTEKLREYGLRHPDAGYSRSFQAWLKSDDPKPYGSKTNGALMRCTSAGWLASSPQEAYRLGRLTALPTHNHQEAMDTAGLAAEIIYRLRMGESVEAMYRLVDKYYPVPKLENIRPITEFDFSCKTTLPIAFAAFYEAVCSINIWKFNNDGYLVVSQAVDNAISLGGDTDTNAAIAAAFAEAWNASWTFSEEEIPNSGRFVWYANNVCCQRELPKQCCTPDIQEVVRRLDEASAQICPLHVCGEFAYRTDDRGEAVIVKYPCGFEQCEHLRNNPHEQITVPSELDGLPVVAVGSFAFEKCNVQLPEGVRRIGDYALAHTQNMQLPDSVEEVGLQAL